jgi:hypothetical protein
MLASKAALQTEIKELNDLVELYIKSNPNYIKKTPAIEEVKAPVIVEKLVEVDTSSIVHKAFKLFADFLLLQNV